MANLDITLRCRAVGLVGTSIYATGVFGLSTGRPNSTKPRDFAAVPAASRCVMISIRAAFTLCPAVIEASRIAIPLSGILLRRARPTPCEL